MAITGIDASRHQGTVDWPQVAAAGHTFAIIKATEGTSYAHTSWYQNNAPRVRAAGLTLGAYHFLRTSDPAAQARYFAATVGSFDGVLAVVDVETAANDTKPQIEHVRGFAAEFRRLVPGRPLIVYTGKWYWVGHMGGPGGADIGPLWHSEYETSQAEVDDGPEGLPYGGWDRATIWQWTSSGACPGVAGRCDLNMFNGTASELAALAGGTTTDGTVPTPRKDFDMFIVRRTTQDGAIALGGPGYWRHVGPSEWAAMQAAGAPTPQPVDQEQWDHLRAACLHGERCANDATS